VGERVERATGIASDILLGLIVAIIVVMVIRHRRKAKEEIGPAEHSLTDPGGPGGPGSAP
jgi:hypothetical protein